LQKRFNLLLLVLVMTLLFSGCHKHRGPKRAEPVDLLSVPDIYSKGEACLKKGKTTTARKYFEQVTLREDAGEFKDKALISIADSFYDEDNISAYSEAISRYQTFLAFHAMHPTAPYCQYRIGLCYFKEIDRPDRDVTPAVSAKESFRRLIENYPNSEYVKDAKEKQNEVENILAAHEIYVGDFYLKQGHPKSAESRYQKVLDTYPNYWNLPLVTFRLAEAEREDKNYEKAKLNYEKVVSLSPDSQMAKDAKKTLESMGKKESRETRLEKKVLEAPLPKVKKKHWWKFWGK
jgi:outer membrane protein assembly factor BamD